MFYRFEETHLSDTNKSFQRGQQLWVLSLGDVISLLPVGDFFRHSKVPKPSKTNYRFSIQITCQVCNRRRVMNDPQTHNVQHN